MLPDTLQQQIDLLGDLNHYKRDGWGSIYVVVRIDAHGALQVKVGHTNCMPRRKREYRRCESSVHAMDWHFHCKVEKRMLVERLIHLSFMDLDATVVRYRCPGYRCRKRHREFYSLNVVGGLDVVEEIVCHWVWAVGGNFIMRRL